MEIELELTYLLKHLPKDILTAPSKEIIDIYFPATDEHPKIRLRKNGTKLELTKKVPIDDADTSTMSEQTIPLTPAEYAAFATLPGKRVAKRRYFYKYGGRTAEIDVFLDNLSGLILVDFEFETQAEKQAFAKPDFCLADVTHEKAIAGGMLCGKSFAAIAPTLLTYGYEAISFP